jgi:hypothetical protein
MATLQRLEVWTDLQCAGGTRQAILPVDHCTRLATTERITRDDEATLELSKEADAYAYLSVGGVVRLLYTDAAFEEWRISEVHDASQSARTARVSLQSVLFDLNVKDNPMSTTTSGITTLTATYENQTTAQLVTAIMAYAPSWFDVGTVDSTEIIPSITFSSAYPLRALQQLAQAVRDAGADCEVNYRRNGTTGYYADLVTAIGATADEVDVRTAKNLLATVRARRLVDQASSVIPVGASGVVRSGTPATIALAFWRVTSISGSDIELRGLEGCDDPIQYDDEFNGYYLQKSDGTTYTQITDTVASTQKVTVASAASISVGHWLRIVSTSGGNDVVKLTQPTAAAPWTQSKVLSLPQLDDGTNWVWNPRMDRWTAGLPDGWTETDGLSKLTVTEDLTREYFGDRSAKLTFSNPTPGNTASARITSASIPIPPSGTSRTVTASFWIYFDHAGSSFGVRNMLVTCGIVSAGSVTNTTFSSSQPSPTDSWVRIDVTRTGTTTGMTVYVEMNQAGSFGGTPPFIDPAVINVGAVILRDVTTVQPGFIIGSRPAQLWAAGHRYLTAYSTPPTTYQVSFADLGAWDPTAFPYDNVTLGATANVRDTDLNVTTSERIIEVTRDRRNPLASQFTVSTRPPDLVSTLTGIADL